MWAREHDQYLEVLPGCVLVSDMYASNLNRSLFFNPAWCLCSPKACIQAEMIGIIIIGTLGIIQRKVHRVCRTTHLALLSLHCLPGLTNPGLWEISSFPRPSQYTAYVIKVIAKIRCSVWKSCNTIVKRSFSWSGSGQKIEQFRLPKVCLGRRMHKASLPLLERHHRAAQLYTLP